MFKKLRIGQTKRGHGDAIASNAELLPVHKFTFAPAKI